MKLKIWVFDWNRQLVIFVSSVSQLDSICDVLMWFLHAVGLICSHHSELGGGDGGSWESLMTRPVICRWLDFMQVTGYKQVQWPSESPDTCTHLNPSGPRARLWWWAVYLKDVKNHRNHFKDIQEYLVFGLLLLSQLCTKRNTALALYNVWHLICIQTSGPLPEWIHIMWSSHLPFVSTWKPRTDLQFFNNRIFHHVFNFMWKWMFSFR